MLGSKTASRERQKDMLFGLSRDKFRGTDRACSTGKGSTLVAQAFSRGDKIEIPLLAGYGIWKFLWKSEEGSVFRLSHAAWMSGCLWYPKIWVSDFATHCIYSGRNKTCSFIIHRESPTDFRYILEMFTETPDVRSISLFRFSLRIGFGEQG